MAGDEAARARQAVELTGAESWKLLSSVSLGRIVFTQRAMPAIRPVNHLVDGQTIIVRSHLPPAAPAGKLPRQQAEHAAQGGGGPSLRVGGRSSVRPPCLASGHEPRKGSAGTITADRPQAERAGLPA